MKKKTLTMLPLLVFALICIVEGILIGTLINIGSAPITIYLLMTLLAVYIATEIYRGDNLCVKKN